MAKRDFNRVKDINEPAPTVMTHGRRRTQSEMSLPTQPLLAPETPSDKPAYNVPSMAEVAALPKNGLTVVSTFSGCGGSCLGFEMAGYTVLWANEFIPAARDVYELNHPGVIVDPRSIRDVTGQDILDAIGRNVGEIDVLEGSPPCASFSTAGKREKDWGKVKKYSDGAERTDDLFFDFVRILGDLQPKVFVAENVSGLVKGTAKGYFKRILAAMRDAGYRVEAKLLDAQWLGVPQARQRIIFVGVRNDIDKQPAFPLPLPYRYSVLDALPWISGFTSEGHGWFGGNSLGENQPAPTVTAGSEGAEYYKHQVRITGRTGPQFARVETELDQPMNAIIVQDPAQTRYEIEVRPTLRLGAHGFKAETTFDLNTSPSPTVSASGVSSYSYDVDTGVEKRKFTIAELKRICAFPDDFQLTGTYAQQWERLGRAVPPLMMRAVAETVRDRILLNAS